MRPQWLVLEGLRSELAALPSVADAGLPDRVAGLVQALAGQRAREERVAGLAAAESDERARLEAHLGRLGPGWSAARVREFDDSVAVRDEVRHWRGRLEAAADKVEAAEREHEAAARQVAVLHDERARIAAESEGPEPRPADQIESDARRLSGLQADVHDLQQQRLIEQSVAPVTPMGVRVVLLAGSLAALSAAGAAAAALVGYGQLAVGLAVAAVLLASIWAVTLAARRGSDRGRAAGAGSEHGAGAGPGSPVDQLAARVAATAAAFDLPAPPTAADIGAARARLDAERETRGRWDALAGRVRDAELRLAEGSTAAERLSAVARRAGDERDVTYREWKDRLADQGLSGLSPQGFFDLLGVVGEARAADAAAERAAAELAGIEAAAADWDAAARAALEAAGGAPVPRDRETLRAALQTLHRELSRRAAVTGEIHHLEDGLTVRFGAGPAAEDALAELPSGDDAEWREEERRLAQEVGQLEEDRVAAIETRAQVRQRREEVERSADLPRLQSELESLRAGLAGRVREYRELAVARSLVAGTLQTFVRERQPAVLARASEAFARITDGRYTGVEQDEAGDESVVVVSADGRLTPDQLSRGTAEQLYLIIRLALAAEFARRSEPLPLIMDDCLVNFDPQRAEQVARLLVETSREGQCLLFTCHPETVDLITAQAGDDVRVIDLAPPA